MKEFSGVLQSFEASFDLMGLFAVLLFWLCIMAIGYGATGSPLLAVAMSGALRIVLLCCLAIYKLLDSAAYSLIKNHYINHEGEVKHVQFFF